MPSSLISKVTMFSTWINMYQYQIQFSFLLALIPVSSFPPLSFIVSWRDFPDNLCSVWNVDTICEALDQHLLIDHWKEPGDGTTGSGLRLKTGKECVALNSVCVYLYALSITIDPDSFFYNTKFLCQGILDLQNLGVLAQSAVVLDRCRHVY